MSLISRIEVTNYLTEGINSNRRVADWNPMLTGITLRMDDGKSALVNITNGGGKTSLVEILLYLLSRDPRLLKRLRDKLSPKSHGYTHARIEFRAPPDDSYAAPSLLEVDLDNLAGATHVLGVVLTDDVNDLPIFYGYSGTLEDSPCYHNDGVAITGIADAEFTNRTRSRPGCKWNKFNSRREWEDQISLFVSVEVVRRNVVYQLKGSDDKNASFFDFQPRGGESYDSAFFRAVVAPDLLTNLLNSFSDEDELTVEDTLHKSLSRIVAAEKEVVRKEKHLAIRQGGIERLQPILNAGQAVKALQSQKDNALRGLRKDVALARHFGDPGVTTAIPGFPRSPKTLPRVADQDPRLLLALKGMVITPDEGILILDKAMSELTGVEVGTMRQTTERKHIPGIQLRSQVIDLYCSFGIPTSGVAGGGHYRKGYSRESATVLPGLLIGINGARVDGLQQVLNLAFDISETQLDTNPASIELRRLSSLCQKTQKEIDAANEKAEDLKLSIEQMESQIEARKENQAAWDDFVKIGPLLPENVRQSPLAAKEWFSKRIGELKGEIESRNIRSGKLSAAWTNYISVMERAGLEGLDGVRTRHEELTTRQRDIKEAKLKLDKSFFDARVVLRSCTDEVGKAQTRSISSTTSFDKFEALKTGFLTFKEVFGNVLPQDVNPTEELKKAEKNLTKKRYDRDLSRTELTELQGLRSQASTFAAIFGQDADPLRCDPIGDDRKWSEAESAARESMAALFEKVEALDAFEAMAPGVLPAAWIVETDARRVALEGELTAELKRKDSANREIKAIEQMQVVDDGSFWQAWNLLDRSGLNAQRLHQVMFTADKTVAQRTSALSALSGILSAPVFDTMVQLEKAASLLGGAGISVPLVHKDALLQAIDAGVSSHGDVRMFGFIGGNYSRRVRILLEPDYALSEIGRLKAEILVCDESLQIIRGDLVLLQTTSENYILALKAQEALVKGVRDKYKERQADVETAEAKRAEIRPRLKKGSLEVLRCAAEFIRKGGADRAKALESTNTQLDSEVIALEKLHEVAQVRASFENLTAHAQAGRYVQMGGESAHQHAKSEHDNAKEALQAAKGRETEASEDVGRLEDELVEVNTKSSEFDSNQCPAELERLTRALRLAESDGDKEFMESFTVTQAGLTREEAKLTDSLSVNFDRAASFKENLNETDQQLQMKLAEKKLVRDQQIALVTDSGKDLQRIKQAEIPSWEKVRRAIHELAWELGRRVAMTRDTATGISNLEEGDAVPEVHPSYLQVDAIAQHLRSTSLDSSGLFVDRINEVISVIQHMDLEGATREFTDVKSKYDAAIKSYEEKNSEFCAAARKQAGTQESAFNALEIEEIEKADPLQMQALADLFGRMSESLEKDRQDAQRAKAVAEEANKDSINQLSGLIRIAQDNLAILEKVMARYPGGRFFVSAQIAGEERIREILSDLKDEVVRANGELETTGRTLRRSDETSIKKILRDTLIDRVFMDTEVGFINGGIWSGKRSLVTHKLSTGQKIALEFMWIVRQAEYEIERGLRELTSKQAAKSRALTNRVIMIDGIFSTLSDRSIIKEALNGLKGLGGNFQIIGFLHSPTWTNDFDVFPVYHVGKKLTNRSGNGLVTFVEAGREPGSIGFFSSVAKPAPPLQPTIQ